MNSLDYLVRTRQGKNDNNFMLLRLLAATMVMYGHSYALSPVHCDSCRDVVKTLTSWLPAQTIGVDIFFIISGFLVFASYDQRDDLASYLKSRALRIFPGLIVCVALMVLVVGPLFTTLPIGEYFRNDVPRQYFLTNASLYSSMYELPGVLFTTTKFGTAVNGSLWTIPVEARLYLLVALVGVFGLVRSRTMTNVALAALVLAAIAYPKFLPLLQPDPGHYRVAAFFAIGAFAYSNKQYIPMDWRVLAFLTAITALSANVPSFEYLCGATLAYGVLCVAYAPRIPMPRWIDDYSYGIYLYAFPIQQIIGRLYPSTGPYKLMAVAIPMAWIAGALSWHLVEKRALAFKSKRKNEVRTSSKQGLTTAL